MLSLGHCRQVLANEEQESMATVSMKRNHFISLVAHRSRSVSQSLLAYLQYVSTECQGEYTHNPLLCCLKVHTIMKFQRCICLELQWYVDH